jgi:hypothetical protein
MFKKYTQGVYCMQSEDDNLQHESEVTVTTKHGKDINVIVWKKLSTRNEHTFYSVIRIDGYDRAEHMRRKIERAENAQARQEKLANEYYNKSNKDRDFLSLAEPIKIGHHSEKRHRKIINQAYDNMGKSVAASNKAKSYNDKIDTLESRLAYNINLDTPESLELLEQRVIDLEQQRDNLKASKNYESYQLTNLGANIRRYKERLETARKLWDINYIPTPKVDKKAEKQKKVDALLSRCEAIFAFSSEQLNENRKEGYTYINCGAGLLIPTQHYETFKTEYKEL